MKLLCRRFYSIASFSFHYQKSNQLKFFCCGKIFLENPSHVFFQYTESYVPFLLVPLPQFSQKQLTMARSCQSKKRLGRDAKCSVLLSRLRPSAVVNAKFPNRHSQKRLKDLVCIKIEDATHGGHTTKSVFFSSPSIPDEELYCSRKFCVVLEEGPSKDFFDEEDVTPTIDNEAPTLNNNEIDSSVFRAGNRSEDIEFVRNQGLAVDDDNKPAPENVPDSQVVFSRLFDSQSWGYDGIDRRRASVPIDNQPTFQGGWTAKNKILMEVFLKMLPYNFFKTVVLEKTSSALVENKFLALGEGEFLRYISIWLLMLTCSGWSRNDFWSTAKFDKQSNACSYNLMPTCLRDGLTL